MTHGVDTSFLIAVEVVRHHDCYAARTLLADFLNVGDTLAIAPQVLTEFMHVVTDTRRFESPFDATSARRIALDWWNASTTVQVFPDNEAV